MNTDTVYEVVKMSLTTSLIVAGPVMLTALVLGTVVTLLQTITSVQEQTLTFVPKMIAAGLVIWLLAPWMLQKLGQLLTTFFIRAGQLG
jgi:flagellar biosynthetic protein FliQ